MSEEIKEVDYTDIDNIIKDIISKVRGYMKNVPRSLIEELIMKAYIYAKEAHHLQFRKSWEPYIIHPVEATKELLILKPDLITIQACLLHDVPEDTPRTIDEIRWIFWDEVAHIVSWMEKLSWLKYRWEERRIGSLRKMFIAISEDIRVVFVKLADRIHNMKTIDWHQKESTKERIAIETLNIYAPIADRLGIYDFKEILENLCFRYLYPKEYNEIKAELDLLKEEQKIFISKAKDIIYNTIPAHIPLIDVSYRIKSAYSIFKKTQRKDYEKAKDLYDLFAIRIITDNIPHCYEILWEIHNKWSPISKRFKDYIAIPKENWYQSLHTTVLGVLSELRTQPTEIQIRTIDMHVQAEIWIAAHFEYSETGKSAISKDTYWVSEIKRIVDQSKEKEDTEFMSSMKLWLFDDRIFVFSPKWDVINLPKWSTPVDFAYSIHSDLGNHIAIAKINAKIVPLDYELNNWDRVEVIVDKMRKPLITWLTFVKTARAKEVIKNYINKENRDELIEKWKFILNSYLESNYWIWLTKDLGILKNIDGRILDTKEKEDVLVQIGNLSRKPSSVVRWITQSGSFSLKKISPKEEIKNIDLKTPTKEIINKEWLIIGWEKNIPYKIAQCCKPIYWDRIVGYITRTWVNIHKTTCNSLKKSNFERYIDTQWIGCEHQKQWTNIKAYFIFENKVWVLKKFTEILFKMNINIEEISTEKLENDTTKISTDLKSYIEDYYLFDRLVEIIKFSIKEYREWKLIDIK